MTGADELGTDMTPAQKEVLRDLFEGCFNFEAAWRMAGIDNRTAFEAARRTWTRWQREMDEDGFYTY